MINTPVSNVGAHSWGFARVLGGFGCFEVVLMENPEQEGHPVVCNSSTRHMGAYVVYTISSSAGEKYRVV